jgi:hypothetical protein
MKKRNEQQRDVLLSQYVDGTLSEQEIRDIESILSIDSSARKKIEELKSLKKLLVEKEKLEPDMGFWTRCEIALEERRKEERSFLPFSSKYNPAMSVSIAAVILIAGALVMQNRMQVVNFFTEKSQAFRNVYEKNILQGQLLPLFTKVDKDRALQFSLLGTLALDDTSKTELRVDEQSKKGYRIEVGKDSQNKKKTITFDRFLAEVQPTAEQKILIDSMLELTGKRIESSVFIGENNTIAISPDLPKLNKLMVTNIASCLEPNQRIHFERLLEAHDGPYTVASNNVVIRKGNPLFQKIPQSPHGDDFVIITPDTMIYSQIHVNFDSLRHRMEENMIAFELRREAMLKRIQARHFQRMAKDMLVPPSEQSQGKEEYFSVEIHSSNDENEQQQMRVIVAPRIRKQIFEPGKTSHPLQVRVWRDTLSEEKNP